MRAVATELPGVLLLEPKLFGDARGWFMESYNERAFEQATGLKPAFVQDNHSRSARGVLRGLHYQVRNAQAKLVRVTAGEVFDVAVDVRRGSATFGRWAGARLSADNHLQMWVPEGFAHGYLVLSDFAELQYKTTDFYAPAHERGIAWDDPELAIQWPLPAGMRAPVLSAKDQAAPRLRQAEVFP